MTMPSATAGSRPPVTAVDPLLQLILARTGIRLRARGVRLLRQHVERRMRALGSESVTSYCRYVNDAVGECSALLDAVLNTESYFFRNAALWDYVGRDLLPRLVRDARAAGRSRVHAWSAAASNGAEAYTLAILWRDHTPTDANCTLQITGTDVCAAALRRAAAATYPEHALSRVEPRVVEQCFLCDAPERQYTVRDGLRALVTFATHDVRKPFAHAAFDLVLLRNVLLHLDEAAQQRAVATVTAALRPGGYLIVGDAYPWRSSARPDGAPALHRVHPLIYCKSE